MSEQKNNEVQGLDSEIANTTLTLVSRDNVKYDLPRKCAYLSAFIKTTAEQDKSASSIIIERVESKILSLICEYLQHHNGVQPNEIRKPLKSLDMKKVVEDEWDAEFISRFENDYQTLFDLILASNYLDISPLLHLGCAKVASKIKGKTHDEIKKMFIEGGVKIPDNVDTDTKN